MRWIAPHDVISTPCTIELLIACLLQKAESQFFGRLSGLGPSSEGLDVLGQGMMDSPVDLGVIGRAK